MADLNTESQMSHIDAGCPFSIRKLNSTTFLIRENDQYGEYPHIYAMLRSSASSKSAGSQKMAKSATVIILSDTGCGSSVANSNVPRSTNSLDSQTPSSPSKWTLATFLASTINASHQHPYVILSTHCHFDHILGLASLLDPATQANVSVVASALGKRFITPYANLQHHSICDAIGVSAPHYTPHVTVWAENEQRLIYVHANGTAIETGITILQTPGHTPDSLAWYDEVEQVLCVGDSFYERQSWDTRNSGWGKDGAKREAPMPTMFDVESRLVDWWTSLKRVERFVQARNEEFEKERRLRLEQGDVDERDGDWDVLGKEDLDEVQAVNHGAAGIAELEQDGFGTATTFSIATVLAPAPSSSSKIEITTSTSIRGSAQDGIPRTLRLRDLAPVIQPTSIAAAAAAASSTSPYFFDGIRRDITFRRDLALRKDYIQRRDLVLRNEPTVINDIGPTRSEPKTTEVSEWIAITTTPPPHRVCLSDLQHQISPTSAHSKRKTQPQRVLLAAAHVTAPSYPSTSSSKTATVDAAEAITQIRTFISRILRREVPFKRLPDARGEEIGFWDDCLGHDHGGSELRKDRCDARYSVLAPLRIIEDGRRAIPKRD